jgi:hypothetical protein
MAHNYFFKTEFSKQTGMPKEVQEVEWQSQGLEELVDHYLPLKS